MNYTPEQERNAMLYGVCLTCGTPRERHRGEETHPDGKVTHWMGLVAPCGHPQDRDAALDPIIWPPYDQTTGTNPDRNA